MSIIKDFKRFPSGSYAYDIQSEIETEKDDKQLRAELDFLIKSHLSTFAKSKSDIIEKSKKSELIVMEKYHKERVTLETDEGTAHSRKEFIEVWQSRIKEYFPHYKLKSVKFMREQGKEKL